MEHMDSRLESEIKEQARALIGRSGFPTTAEEMERLTVNDLGLGNAREEGFTYVDILLSPRLRISVLVLLPRQSLPQHVHPPYENDPGKEETIRVLYGECRLYVPGPANNPGAVIPSGKERYYTARHEIVLGRGEQYYVAPNVEHWFQGGEAGAVTLSLYNRADESKNVFYDPRSKGFRPQPR